MRSLGSLGARAVGSSKGYRNGYSQRDLVTSTGHIEDVNVWKSGAFLCSVSSYRQTPPVLHLY